MPSLFSQTGIENDARNASRMLRYAFANAKNRHTVTACDKHRICGNNRFSLSAVNPHSRIVWGDAVWNEMSEFFCDNPDAPDHNRRLYFVTLIDLKCVTKVDATDVSLPYIARRLRLGLRGLNYLAAIEPAFYVNMQAGVEDDTLVRWNAADMLEEAGFSILQAANADEAIALLETCADITRRVEESN